MIVRLLMLLQLDTITEHEPTNVTRAWFERFAGGAVNFQVAIVRKLLAAIVALVWFFSRVNDEMFLEV